MNTVAKNKEECQVVLKKPNFTSKHTDKQLITLKKECLDEVSSENQSKCFVLGYN